MKRLVIILVLALSSFVCFADDCKETKISDEVLAVVNGVCDKLQVPAEKVWTTVLSSQVSRGTVSLVYCGSILIIFLIVLAITIKVGNRDIDSIEFVFLCILTIVFAISSFICIINSYDAIIQILNPEYATLEELQEIIKDLKLLNYSCNIT